MKLYEKLKNFPKVKDLDLEEIITHRPKNRSLQEFIELEDGEIQETQVDEPSNAEITQNLLPMALGNYLTYHSRNLRQLVINYEYFTKKLCDMLVSSGSSFGENLYDIHFRIDKSRLYSENRIYNDPVVSDEPGITELARITKMRPRVRFSLAFEHEMAYGRHCQIMGGPTETDTFRLHRLEFRGDAYYSAHDGPSSLSPTCLRILPRYHETLRKFIIDFYHPLEDLDAELMQLLATCKQLRVLKMKLFIKLETVQWKG